MAQRLLQPIEAMPILRRRLKSRVPAQGPPSLPAPYCDAAAPRPPEQRPGSRIEVRYATLEVVERLVELQEQVLPLRVLLERALPVLLSSAGVSTGALLVYKPDSERLVLVAQQGLSEAGISVLQEICPGGITGWEIPLHALLNRKAYIIDHIAEHPFVPRLVPVEKLGQVTNLAMVPLYRSSTPTGMVILIADKGRPLEERHVLSLVLPLALLAVSIDQDRRVGNQTGQATEPSQEPAPCRPLEVSHLVEEGRAEKLRQQAEVALGELESLREQLVEAKAELEAERRRSAAAGAARDRALQSAERLESETGELRARVKSAEAECSQFKQRLAAVETEREGLDRQLNLAKEQLMQSRANLGAAQEELSVKRSALARALDQVDAAKCEMASARKKLAEVEACARSETDDLKATLARERKEAREKIEVGRRAEEELRNELLARTKAQERLATLEKEMARARQEEAAARGELARLGQEMRARERKLTEQVAALKAQAVDQSAKASALASRLEAERRGKEQVQSRLEAERKEREEALCRSQSAVKEVEDKLARALAGKSAAEQELATRAAALERLSVSLEAARAELARKGGEGQAAQAEARLEQEVKAQAKKRADLEAAVGELRARCERLAAEVAAEREEKERVHGQAARSEERIARLAETVAAAERRWRQAQVDLNDAHAAAEAYRQKLEEVTRELALGGDERQAAVARAEEDLAEQKRRTEALAREIESVRDELGTNNQIRERLEAELRALNEKLAGERSVVQRLRRAYTESEKLRIRTAEDLAASEARRKELEHSAAEQAARLAAVGAEMNQARSRMAELEDRCRRLEQVGSKTQEEGLRWQAALSQLNAALSEVRAQLAAKAAEAEGLAKSAEAAEQKLREIKASWEEAEKQAASEKSRREALEAKLRALTGEYESWARSRSGWKLERERAPVEIRSWSARKMPRPGPAVERGGTENAGVRVQVEAGDRSEITVIDDEGLDAGRLMEALGRLGMQVKSVKRTLEEEPRSAVALVNLMASQAQPFRALLALTQRAPQMPAVSYVRDPATNRGFCLGATLVVEGTAPGDRVAGAVGQLCRNAKRVLTVSGDIDAMIGCKNALTRADYAMSMACDARQGADLLELVRPDVVIVDTRMPERNTARFLESLRALGGQGARGLILLVPALPEGVEAHGKEALGGLQLPEEIGYGALAEAVVAAETLKRGFSMAGAAGGMQELLASGSRLAG